MNFLLFNQRKHHSISFLLFDRKYHLFWNLSPHKRVYRSLRLLVLLRYLNILFLYWFRLNQYFFSFLRVWHKGKTLGFFTDIKVFVCLQFFLTFSFKIFSRLFERKPFWLTFCMRITRNPLGQVILLRFLSTSGWNYLPVMLCFRSHLFILFIQIYNKKVILTKRRIIIFAHALCTRFLNWFVRLLFSYILFFIFFQK